MSNWAQSMQALLSSLLTKGELPGNASGKKKKRRGKQQLSAEQKRIVERMDKARMTSSSPREEDMS